MTYARECFAYSRSFMVSCLILNSLSHFEFIFVYGVRAREVKNQTVKNLTAMQETQVRSIGQEDPLEKGMVTHFSILAWRIPGKYRPL